MTAMGEYHSNFADARRDADCLLGRPDAGCLLGRPDAGCLLGRPDAGGGGQHHLFDRIDWFEGLHRACLSDSAPVIAHARNGDASLWLFLTERHGQIRAMRHFFSFAWRPVWAARPDDAAAVAMAEQLAKGLKRHGATVDLSPLPQEDGSAELLETAFRRAGWLVDLSQSGVNHWLEPAGRSFDDWWAQRPGALRSTVQRKGRKNIVALDITSLFTDDRWDDYEAVYAASWKPEESDHAFLRDWARGEAAAGTLRLGIARIDGVPVAAQYWSVDDGTAYIHKLAHVAGHDALSPGTLLTHAMFRMAFDVERVTRIDFGTGDDGYKRDWMECAAPLMTLRAWNPADPRAWPGIARRLAKRVATKLSPR
jgi:hypothetical protein